MKNFRWEKGRQDSGYSKMLILTGMFPVGFDIYILKYPTGSEIKEHTDPVTSKRHYRLNIILRPATEGGEFHCANSIINTKRIKYFRPDLNVHSMTKVTKGTRYVLSIGWAVK